MNQAYFQIAGLTFSVISDFHFETMCPENHLSRFMTSAPDQSPDFSIQWQQADNLPSLPEEDLVYDPKEVWRMFKGKDGYDFVIDIDNLSRWESHPPKGRLYIDKAWEKVLLIERTPGPKERRLENLFSGVVELIVRTRIISKDGLMFHSCGLDDNGSGILMVGPSGAGKSTQADIWCKEHGVTVLCDDRTALRLNNNHAAIFGTPWGDPGRINNHMTSLKAILLIVKADKNKLVSLPNTEALPLLTARSFLPFWDQNLMGSAMELLDRICAMIPVYLFYCRPESSVISLVRSTL